VLEQMADAVLVGALVAAVTTVSPEGRRVMRVEGWAAEALLLLIGRR